MKIRALYKVLISILIFVMLSMFCTNAYAFETQYSDPNRFNTKTNDNIQIGSFSTKTIITKILGYLLNIMRIVALGWAIIMGLAIAMKYMSGSAQIKSQIKLDAPTYIIGTILLFGAAGILTLVNYFVSDMTT